MAQLLSALTSGGQSLADAERLGRDRVLMELIGLSKGADQTALGQFLRAQTQQSVHVPVSAAQVTAPFTHGLAFESVFRPESVRYPPKSVIRP